MKRRKINDVLTSSDRGVEITVAGWVRTRRDSKGGFSFLQINDGSCFECLQIVAGEELENYREELCRLHPGASVRVTGTLVESAGRGQDVEVQAREVRVLGFSDPEQYPLGKQRVSFERLRELAHLRPRTNAFGAVARVRNALAQATHRFFDERGFLYVNTPIVTGSDCEGAGEMFRVTTLPPGYQDNRAKADGKDPLHEDFFGRPTYLTVSGQLEGEAYACALGEIYTFGPTFRAENSNTRRHLAEFWMIE
ncbi:MAG: amino acid--tRNA ligase-related protein, partial [Verrucomicrobiota bacterium]